MRRTTAAVALGIVLALTGCSSSPTATPTTSVAAATFPVTISNNNASVTIAAQPAAIISLSPTATEMLFAIGAGSQVIAVDDQSNFPADAPKSDLSGFTPNLEAIVGKKPDLVVVSNDISNIVSGLTNAGVPVLVEPAATTIDDTYAQITQLGQATGHTDGAASTVADMKSRIEKSLADAGSATGQSVYHELDNTYYSATSSTFIGSIYKAFGLTNIADTAPDAASGYPQLSAEYIVTANPSLVFLADTKCCQVDAAAFAARSGFNALAAVTSNHVFPLDDDIASRWGPRTADLYEAIAQAIKQAK